MKTKYSVGIICCRFGGFNASGINHLKTRGLKTPPGLTIPQHKLPKTPPSCLLICKRYTYAFNSFLHGHYKDRGSMIELFGKMTTDEKLDIASLNFDQIWYRVWLHANMQSLRAECKKKFDLLLVEENPLAPPGFTLRALLSNTTSGKRIWEAPKGRKKFAKEPDLLCAIREFEEETGIGKKKYKIYNNKIVYSFIDEGVKYVNTYYIAVTKYNIEPVIKLDEAEVCDAQWLDLPSIKIICPEFHGIVKRAMNFIKKNNEL